MLSPIKFLEALRETDRYIRDIYMQGGCYRFALLLCKMYKGSEILINDTHDHVITKIGQDCYDIEGLIPTWVVRNGYHKITQEEMAIAEKWSFSRNYRIKITECPFCEEPIT